MKKLIKVFSVETFALFVAAGIASGIVFERGLETLIMAGLVLTAASLFVKPIINMLLLPINLITFNFFKWVSAAVALYLVTLAVSSFKIVNFAFAASNYGFSNFPVITVEGPLAIIGFSFIISMITGLVGWIFSSS